MLPLDASTIARSLDGKQLWNGGWSCKCPVPNHGKGKGDKSRSLSVKDGYDGKILVKCFAGCDPCDVIEELRAQDLWPEHIKRHSDKRPPPKKPAPSDDVNKYRNISLDIWHKCVPARGTLVETYLRSRAITILPPPSIRFHSALWHSGVRTEWPAMVGVVSCGQKFMAIHRTWLSFDGRGKAPIENNKMALGGLGGGAVRLGPECECLCIAEGIETALSIQQATGIFLKNVK